MIGIVMFVLKFLENIFSNSLKDKPGPSFAYAYLLSWAIINWEYPIKFLSKNGNLSEKVAALSSLSSSPSYLWPVSMALLVVLIKPWLNNLGLLAREYSDKSTQTILMKLNIKSYRTEEEFQAVISINELKTTENTKLKAELDKALEELSKIKSNSRDGLLQLSKKVQELDEISIRENNLKLTNEEYEKKIKSLIDEIGSLKSQASDSKVQTKENNKIQLELNESLVNLNTKQDVISDLIFMLNSAEINSTNNMSVPKDELLNVLKSKLTISNILMETINEPLSSTVNTLIKSTEFGRHLDGEELEDVAIDFVNKYRKSKSNKKKSALLNDLITNPKMFLDISSKLSSN